MTITTENTEASGQDLTAALFDADAHAALGAELNAKLDAATKELAEAEAELEHAEEAAELIDLLSDTDQKVTKTRLAAERAAARVGKARAVLAGVERQLASHNTDSTLAAALAPMVGELTGRHAAYSFHPLPADPDWSAVEALSVVAVQRKRAAVDTESGILSAGAANDRDAAVFLSFVCDQAIHRSDLLDSDAVLAASTAVGVGLRMSGEPHRGPRLVTLGYQIPTESRELPSGLTVSTVVLWPDVLPELPPLARIDTEHFSTILAGQLRGHLHQWVDRGADVAVTNLVVREAVKGSTRSATLTVNVSARGRDGALDEQLVGQLHRWEGRAFSGIGRCSSVHVRTGSAQLAVSFVFTSSAVA